MLSPGQRLTLRGDAPPVVDAPSIDKVTAWQRGQLIFEDTPLSEAAAEFNRYATSHIELGSPDLADIRVGGTFRSGDVASFARAVADANDLEVVDRGRQLLLMRVRKAR
jgi:transmembrane sensor